MRAFVRFRKIGEGADERFVAWFEPDHFILEAAAPFFVERFRSLRWSILTPVGSAHWSREELTFGPPGRREDARRQLDEILQLPINPARAREHRSVQDKARRPLGKV